MEEVKKCFETNENGKPHMKTYETFIAINACIKKAGIPQLTYHYNPKELEKQKIFIQK